MAFFEATAFSRVYQEREGMMGDTVWLLLAGDFVRPPMMPRVFMR
ncbi:hypothetical protein CHUV0807_0155 [Cardiobacterium hominis]|uniref:Uncharacterized protein n=1 Tax=Cardiobacterium hominis TaxID=2718 RepID=A0A1C3H1Z4_9GAMM|nr:hypothetical protein CHUV0807_0155 [Cardiobacterium hominis]